MKEKIESVLKAELPDFFTRVYEGRFLNMPYIHITIACSGLEINNVQGQFPQKVVLTFDPIAMELKNSRTGIYRMPNREIDNEKYLAMKSERVPFRMPQRNETAVLKALQRFCKAYKKTLQDNFDVLMYKNYVDYEQLLKPEAV